MNYIPEVSILHDLELEEGEISEENIKWFQDASNRFFKFMVSSFLEKKSVKKNTYVILPVDSKEPRFIMMSEYKRELKIMRDRDRQANKEKGRQQREKAAQMKQEIMEKKNKKRLEIEQKREDESLIEITNEEYDELRKSNINLRNILRVNEMEVNKVTKKSKSVVENLRDIPTLKKDLEEQNFKTTVIKDTYGIMEARNKSLEEELRSKTQDFMSRKDVSMILELIPITYSFVTEFGLRNIKKMKQAAGEEKTKKMFESLNMNEQLSLCLGVSDMGFELNGAIAKLVPMLENSDFTVDLVGQPVESLYDYDTDEELNPKHNPLNQELEYDSDN